jgi:hypothetical protein
MLYFKVQDNGRMQADPGQHDDRVMGTAIAKHIRQITPTPRGRANAHVGGREGGMKGRKRVDKRAWA